MDIVLDTSRSGLLALWAGKRVGFGDAFTNKAALQCCPAVSENIGFFAGWKKSL